MLGSLFGFLLGVDQWVLQPVQFGFTLLVFRFELRVFGHQCIPLPATFRQCFARGTESGGQQLPASQHFALAPLCIANAVFQTAYLVASHTLKLPIERVGLFPHLLRPLFGGLCTGTAVRGMLLIFGQDFGDVGMNAIVKPLGANPCAIALLGGDGGKLAHTAFGGLILGELGGNRLQLPHSLARTLHTREILGELFVIIDGELAELNGARLIEHTFAEDVIELGGRVGGLHAVKQTARGLSEAESFPDVFVELLRVVIHGDTWVHLLDKRYREALLAMCIHEPRVDCIAGDHVELHHALRRAVRRQIHELGNP